MISHSEFDQIKKELAELKLKFSLQRDELVIAQQKRAGHYAKLEYQLEVNDKLKKNVDVLKSDLASKNREFLKALVLEKYGENTLSNEAILEKYNNEILVNDQLKVINNNLLLQQEKLQNELLQLKKEFSTLAKEAKIAQEKRAGHYDKLVSALDRNNELEKQVVNYNEAIKGQKQTLTWMLGEAVLKCKTVSGLFSFPQNIFRANKKFKAYQTTKKNKGITPSLDRNNHNETSQIVKIDSDIVDISILGWPTPEKHKPVTIMSIADTFTTSNLKSVANLITPRPDNWKGLLERDKPEMLFVESAWNGNQNSWQYRVGSYANPPGKEMFSAIEEFKNKKCPTVFWNKEDPVHFDKFKNIAKEFDYIFTSDEGSISKYKQISNATVLALPFAADVTVNNPISSTNRLDKVCFAGSYYANRFIERREDQLMLLEGALPFGLDIYDRNAGNTNKDFHFPSQFERCIKGSLSYEEMNQTYKKYKVFLNVNSVIDSKTMFSRRVFELLASGTPIVSTPSIGIEEFFGKDLVWIVKNRAEAEKAIDTLLNDDIEWRRRSLQGIRHVLMNHTFDHRFQFVLKTIGISPSEEKMPKILCCIEIYDNEDIVLAQSMLRNQETGSKFNMLPMLVVRNNKLKVNLPHLVNMKDPLGNIIKDYAMREKDVHFVSVFSLENVYGKYYLLDQYLSTFYAKADIITKPKNRIDEYQYINNYFIERSLFKKELFEKASFLEDFNSKNRQKDVEDLKVFSIDAANFSLKSGESIENVLKRIEI